MMAVTLVCDEKKGVPEIGDTFGGGHAASMTAMANEWRNARLWRWSSFRAYFLREAGRVRVNEWEVLKMKMPPPAA